MMQTQLDALRLVPFFRDLSDEELEKIRAIVIQRSYKRRSNVFIEGADKEAVYFILNGLVKAFKTDENGNEHIVSFLQTGDMFPHTGFFTQTPYPATAEAIVDTTCLAIPVRSFEQLIINIPEISIKVMDAMSAKIKDLQEKLQQITGHDVQDRGIAFLIKLAENYGREVGDDIHIDLPMTNQEFASTIGTTRETVNRLINQLRKEGIIESKRNGYIVKDFDGLLDWSQR